MGSLTCVLLIKITTGARKKLFTKQDPTRPLAAIYIPVTLFRLAAKEEMISALPFPTARNVTPARFSDIFRNFEILLSAGVRYSSAVPPIM